MGFVTKVNHQGPVNDRVRACAKSFTGLELKDIYKRLKSGETLEKFIALRQSPYLKTGLTYID